MNKTDDGSLEFLDSKGRTFRFEKINLDKHTRKRPKIISELDKIEATIKDPDCLTLGPGVKWKRNFYKVLSYEDGRINRNVSFCKIPVYFKNKRLAIIATCIFGFSPNYYVINKLEKNYGANQIH